MMRRIGAVAVCWLVCFGLARAGRADPPSDYILNCRGCHGPDGRGLPGGAPTFQGVVAKFLWVPGGREYLIRVPGTAQSELNDERTAALLNWLVRAFSAAEIPQDFVPFTGEEVARYRHVPLADVAATRRGLLRALSAQEAAHAVPGARP